MIKNYDKYKDFEDSLILNEPADLKANFLILDELYNEACLLKVFPLKNPLDDIEIDIKLARVLNGVSKIT